MRASGKFVYLLILAYLFILAYLLILILILTYLLTYNYLLTFLKADLPVSSLYRSEKDGENIGILVENKHINRLEVNLACIITE